MKTINLFFLRLFIAASVTFFLSFRLAMAVPAAPDLSVVSQPDGTEIEVYVKGDEWQNWVETPKGHTVARDKVSKK